jgi:hypothetical protein
MTGRTSLILLFGVVVACYIISWPLSSSIVYSYHVDNTYRQTAPASIQDVEIEVSLNAVTRSWNRSWLCPTVVSGESVGPYVAVVQLDDPAMKAKRYRINSAQLKRDDGTLLRLSLVTEHLEQADGQWHPFFKNASRWIGHVYHDGELALNGPVTLQLDITIEKDEKQRQALFDIPLAPTVKRRQGIVMR